MKKGLVALIGGSIGTAIGATVVGKFNKDVIEDKDKKIDKFKSYYNMLNQWLILKQEGKSIEKYFIDNGYKTIAVYGMGEMGNRLYDELKNSTVVEIKYAIDKNAAGTYSELDVIDVDDEMNEVDAIIVSAIFAFDEIEEELREKINCPIISLEDVVYDV